MGDLLQKQNTFVENLHALLNLPKEELYQLFLQPLAPLQLPLGQMTLVLTVIFHEW